MNIWNFSGEVLKHGIKGTKYPKLWLQVRLPHPSGWVLDNNNLFLNFDFDANPSTKGGKICSYIKDRLDKDRFFFLHEAFVTGIQIGKKVGEEWINEEVPGIKGRVSNLKLSSKPFQDINIGLVQGTVSQYFYNEEENVSKFIVEDRYRNPKDNTWKSRKIPLLLPVKMEDLTGKQVFAQAAICGKTPQKIDKVYGLVKKLI